jgi:hypothetical protein
MHDGGGGWVGLRPRATAAPSPHGRITLPPQHGQVELSQNFRMPAIEHNHVCDCKSGTIVMQRGWSGGLGAAARVGGTPLYR